ncbi:MAG: hypothetical protein H6735_15845 [Alphaproteobacteria bacterium]|nr:hypothetical protein [Alphaproteobacteria bacterium]
MIAWLLACSGSGTLTVADDRPAPHTGETGTTPVPTTFEGLAEASGLRVSAGSFTFTDSADCCRPGVSCLWNNPSTPYGVYAVPPLPDEPPVPAVDGWSSLFRMRGDEAVVYLGRTPPRAAYFSFRTYAQYRPEPLPQTGELVPLPVLGSLGPSLNQIVVGERAGADAVWDAPMAVVTTADAALERQIVDWLVQTGWDADHVQVDRIPPGEARLGVGEDADLLSMVVRVALFEDADAGAAWMADPGATVLRLTPLVERPVAEPHPRQPIPPGGSGTGEEAWASAEAALGEAILGGFPGFLVFEQTSNPLREETYDCLPTLTCFGESTDRYNARIPSFFLWDDGSFVLSWGVNHGRVGKATYSSVAINTVVNQIGLDAVDSTGMPGSARAFVDDPLVDDLYVVAVARDCAAVGATLASLGHDGAAVPCMEVPTTCPGVGFAEPMMLNWRAYLEEATNAAPIPEELVLDRVVKIVPRPGGSP